MSFSQVFESEDWAHYVDSIRPLAITSAMVVTTDAEDQRDTLQSFAEDADVDEESIMSRFRDYLSQPENSDRGPIPAVVLSEFLESFGPLEMTFWRTLPVNMLIRTVEGEIPISQRMSKLISNAFGTRVNFWADMQAEYDEWCSVNEKK
jgi:plasmid maintenance system antidote protein VapI